MALRATTPVAEKKRLKLFMFSTAGIGKTTAAIQFPNAYIIDCEKGTDQYDRKIKANGGVVFKTTEMAEVIAEVKALRTTKHQYRTLVIDPITTVYNDLLEKSEKKVGIAHGRHYGEAGKEMKRLANQIMALDMNVVVTAHAKAVYGDGQQTLGYTFDGWKGLDYLFDLVVELTKKDKRRFGRVTKSRIETFPDEDVFEWSYDAIKKRYDASMLEKESDAVAFASVEQVSEMFRLLDIVRLPDGTVAKWFAKSNVDHWEDMPADTIAKCIEYVRNRIPTTAPAAPRAAPIPATPAEHDAADPATEEQVIQLREMVAAGDPAKWSAYLSTAFGVQDVADLSATQAADIIGKARAKANGNHKPAALAGARG